MSLISLCSLLLSIRVLANLLFILYRFLYCINPSSLVYLVGFNSTLAIWIWILSVLKCIEALQIKLSKFSLSIISVIEFLTASIILFSSNAPVLLSYIPCFSSHSLSKLKTSCHMKLPFSCAIEKHLFNFLLSSSLKKSLSLVNRFPHFLGFPI